MKRGRDQDDPPAFPALPTWAGEPAPEEKGSAKKFERAVVSTDVLPRPEKWGGAPPPPSPWESKPSSSWRPSRDKSREYQAPESVVEEEEDRSWVAPPARKPARPSSSGSGWRARGRRSFRGAYKPFVVIALLGVAGFAFWLLVPSEAWEGLAKGASRLWQNGAGQVVERIEIWRGKRHGPQPVAVSRPETHPKVAPLLEEDKPPPPRRTRTTVNLITLPPGANVIGPRGVIGVTPFAYNVRSGTSETVTFTLDGFEPVSRKIAGGRKKAAEITVELVPKAKAAAAKPTPPPAPAAKPPAPAPGRTP